MRVGIGDFKNHRNFRIKRVQMQFLVIVAGVEQQAIRAFLEYGRLPAILCNVRLHRSSPVPSVFHVSPDLHLQANLKADRRTAA